MRRLVVCAALVLGAACTGGGAAGGGEETATTSPAAASPSAGVEACELLERSEVETLVGEPVRDGRESSVAAAAATSTCLWGDADPAAPGHILTLRLRPDDTVDESSPGVDDQVYELEQLGERAFGVQRAGGGVGVVFSAGGSRVQLDYDVLPTSEAEDHAIDRLVRLASVVRSRLAAG